MVRHFLFLHFMPCLLVRQFHFAILCLAFSVNPLISTADVTEPAMSGISTWRSETVRQLEEESASDTFLTVEQDVVDQHHQSARQLQPPGSSSWQQKMRRRINDISPFSRRNNQGTGLFIFESQV